MPRALLQPWIEKVVLVGLIFALPAPSVWAADTGAAAQQEPAGTPVADGGQPVAAPSTPAALPGQTATPMGLAEAGPFEESTIVQGTINTNLKGVWLLVATAEFAPGKFKNFPQLLKITQDKGTPQLHLLDVRLPQSVEQAVRDANRRTLVAWVPSEDTRKMLAQSWSKLPPAGLKALDEFLYGKNIYQLAAPDHYAAAFVNRTEAINKLLEGSKFGMKIVENYKPRDLPHNSQISQIAQRTTFYGVKTIDKNALRGDMFVGFMAMGAGTPLPFQFPGTFVMYRLAPL